LKIPSDLVGFGGGPVRLSTKGRYGVKAMVDLALHSGGEQPVPLKDIADRQEISEHYLEQLIAGLRKAGLVKSVRGAQGGYLLAQAPDAIVVGDIIRTLEGTIAPADCVAEGAPVNCERADNCVTRILWEKIHDSINSVVNSITLQDMVNEYKRLNGQESM